MAHKTWTLQLDGIKHTVELSHGFFSGKRCIWLDGKDIEESLFYCDLIFNVTVTVSF